jgi:putative DNA primase/helicase
MADGSYDAGSSPANSGGRSKSGPDRDAVKFALEDRAEDLFRQAWGTEKSSRKDWRSRESSARSMVMRGAKRGQWFDHKAALSGDILDFFAVELCGLSKANDDFPRVLREAAAYCGITDGPGPDLDGMRARKVAQDAEGTKQAAREAKSTAALVRALQARAEPLTGSPAAAYLEGRGIDALPEMWSYLPPVQGLGVKHAHRPALVVWACDAIGRVTGGQRILILEDGSRAPEEPRKVAFGSIGGSAARIPAQVEGGPLCIAEGSETAAAIAQATGFEVWAVFGVSGFASAPAPLDRQVILCPDQDASGSPAAKSFDTACDEQARRGVDLWIARAPEPKGSKRDLADTLQDSGPKAVGNAVKQAVKFTPAPMPDFLDNGKDSSPIPILPTVESAREHVREALSRFWTDTQDTASFHVLQVPTGVGKTRAAIKMTALAIAEMRAAGDMCAVCIYAPTHKLNNQILADFEKYAPGVTAAVRRGRPAMDPERPGETMCRNLEAVQRAESFLLDVPKTVCNSCPFEAGCAYLDSQRKKADVYILPHANLDKLPPANIKKFKQGLAFAVIDETPGLIGPVGKIAVAAFVNMRATQPGSGGDAISNEADLIASRKHLADVIKDNGEGPLRADLVRLAFDAETLKSAGKAEWKRKIKDADMPEEHLEQNRTILRMSAIWKELAAMLEDGRPVTARLMVFNDAEAGLSVRVRRSIKLDADLEKAPRVLLDATANRSLIELALGPVDKWHDIEAGAPHMRIEQDASVSMSKSMLQTDFDGWGTDAAKKAAQNNRQHLIKSVRKKAAIYPGQTGLVVTYKATANAIRPHMPQGVTVMHFSDTRGRNDAESVRWALIAGRALTKDYAVIESAETLTGLPVENRSEMMQSQRLYMDGAQQWAEPCEVRGYPDPVAQACMEAIRDAELVQAIGRGRGVNRSAQTPLDILVIGDGLLPFAVHDASGTWAAIKKRDFIEDQLEAGGIAYVGSGAAFAAYGTALSPSEPALRKEIERLGDIPLIGSYRGLSPSPLGVFRLKRNKRAPVWTAVYIDMGQHANPRAIAEAQLGPLAMFEVVEDSSVSLNAAETWGLNAGKNCEAFLLSGKDQAAQVARIPTYYSVSDVEPVSHFKRRLVVISKAETIDSTLMAQFIEARQKVRAWWRDIDNARSISAAAFA